MSDILKDLIEESKKEAKIEARIEMISDLIQKGFSKEQLLVSVSAEEYAEAEAQVFATA